MSEIDQTNPADELDAVENDTATQADELSLLKDRARMMGVTFSNNIGIDALRQKIKEKMEGAAPVVPEPPPLVEPEPAKEPATPAAGTPVVPLEAPKPVRKRTLRQMLVEDYMKLVRVRIQNLDPKKKDLPGEIITVANEYIGTVRKYVPYGEVTDNGWHVPRCIYEFLKARKFQHIRSFVDRRNGGQIKVEQSWAQEFSLEVLPPLTKEEIDKLANAQAAAGNID